MTRSTRIALRTSLLSLLPCLVTSLLPSSACAQVATGTPPFGSISGGPDVLNLGNLNGHLTIHVMNKPGRGTNFTYDLSYDTSAWYPVTSGGTTTWQPVYNWGWHAQTEVATGYISDTVTYQINCNFNGILYTASNWVYHDPYGIAHKFSGSTTQQAGPGCGNAHTSFSALATDGSGLTLNASGLSGSMATSSGEIL